MPCWPSILVWWRWLAAPTAGGRPRAATWTCSSRIPTASRTRASSAKCCRLSTTAVSSRLFFEASPRCRSRVGRRCRSIKTRAERFRNSFFTQVVATLNTRKHFHPSLLSHTDIKHLKHPQTKVNWNISVIHGHTLITIRTIMVIQGTFYYCHLFSCYICTVIL